MKRNVFLWVTAWLFGWVVFGSAMVACSDDGNGKGSPITDVLSTDAGGDTDTLSQDVAEPVDMTEDGSTDTDISDILDTDGGPDLGGPDVIISPEDISTNDVVETDGEATDTSDATFPPDVQIAPETLVFRVNSLQIYQPALCYDIDQNGSCDDLTAIVNALVQGQLDSPEEPLDLIGIFSEYVFPSQNKSMLLGEGLCKRDNTTGQILGCDIVNNAGSALFNNVFNKDNGICSLDPEINAPCFATTTAPSLSVNILGIPFEFNNAKAAGGFDSGPSPDTIDPGVVLSFMSVAQTKTIGLELGGPEPVALFELVKNSPTTVLEDGTVGWTFHLSFTAARVPKGL